MAAEAAFWLLLRASLVKKRTKEKTYKSNDKKTHANRKIFWKNVRRATA
jgi:hypothetical protein